MSRPDAGSAAWHAAYAVLAPGERPPAVLARLADGRTPELVWRNVLGGQTWRLGDRHLKWDPHSPRVDLAGEADRLRALAGRHPVPRVLEHGRDADGQWLVTATIDAESAVSGRWRADPARAVAAIAEGLRRIHALPIDGAAAGWESWVVRTPAALGPRPPVDDPVLVHGDACAPNTLLDADGRFAAHVDLGDLAVGDRWADLAVAAMSLEWNYGPGWEPLLHEAYGIAPDPARIRYYRALWDLES